MARRIYSPAELADTLDQAADLIAAKGWRCDDLGSDERGYCIVGAVSAATGRAAYPDYRSRAGQALRALYAAFKPGSWRKDYTPRYSDYKLFRWNDRLRSDPKAKQKAIRRLREGARRLRASA